MHLRSGVFYRSGNPVVRENISRISTEESTARTPGLEVQQVEENLPDYVSDTSMDTTNSYQSQQIGVEFDYEVKLHFHMENAHGAKIYKDYGQKFAVKVEDHPSDHDPAPWVNFQGDRFMGRDGTMYLMTDNPEDMDRMGNLVRREEQVIDEGPPRVNRPELRPTTSVWVKRVLIDDNTKVLYWREDMGTEFYYLRNSPPDHTTTDEKALYTFMNTTEGVYGDVVFFDKYNQEWEMKAPSELRGLTQNGIPIIKPVIDLGGPSNFNVSSPGTFYMPPPSPTYTYGPRPKHLTQ